MCLPRKRDRIKFIPHTGQTQRSAPTTGKLPCWFHSGDSPMKPIDRMESLRK